MTGTDLAGAGDLFGALPAVDDAALARLHARLAATAATAGVLDVAHTTIDTPVGSLLLAGTEQGLLRVAYASEDHTAVLQHLADRVSPQLLHAPSCLDGAASQLEEYFSGRRTVFDLLLVAEECQAISGLYDEVGRFRSTIDMARYRFGSGQYRYFDHPLPELVARLRAAFYPHLLPVARDWAAKLGRPAPWPDTLAGWLDMCHEAGQTKPTPILLRYREGDWNALHRDLYGDLVFPLQVVVGLDRPGVDHTGGEFLMVEQRPRAQSRGYAATLQQGHGIIFTTRDRPVQSKRGWSSAPMRHGVNTLRSGTRHTLGLVLHDAA